MGFTAWSMGLLSLFAYTHASILELPRQEYTVPEGRFCVTVRVPTDEPPDLSAAQQVNWYSKPAMTLDLYVQTYLQNVFNASVSKFKLDNAMLYVGDHDVRFKYSVGRNKKHTLAVNLDGRSLEPIKTETYYTTDSTFKVIKVYAKGPLLFNWDVDCSEVVAPTTTETVNTKAVMASSSLRSVAPYKSSASTKSTSSSTVTASTPQIPTGTTDIDSNVNYEHLSKRGSQWRVIFWSIFGSVSLIIILIGITVLVWNHRQKHKKVFMRRRMMAEQEKQRMMRQAQRLSYQEQQLWVGQRPNSPIFQPPVAYSALSQQSS